LHLLFLGTGTNNSLLFYIFKILHFMGWSGGGEALDTEFWLEDVEGENDSETSV
jgi:hypothetical protein